LSTSAGIPAWEGEDEAEEGGHDEETETAEQEAAEGDHNEELERYDSQLASIYVLPVNASGHLILSPGSVPPPYELNQAAVNRAFTHGVDVRTVHISNEEPVRILTYRIDSSEGPFFFQVGRSLADQNRVSNQFLLGLVLLGALCSALVGLASWWLSGKSIAPAQTSWDQQQTFVSNASHELRTPLTLIRASAEVLQRNQSAPVDDEQSALVSDILTECDYMDRLVNDLLLLSRLDTHRLQLRREPVALTDLVVEIVALAQKLAGEKQLHIEAGPVQGRILGDRQRLRQVLLILLDNAIRHTPTGGQIRLEAEYQGKTCHLVVSDNGAGIAPEHLPHIFDRFYQAAPTDEDQGRGNGLGLSIAKGLMEAQGGAIHVTSQSGQGTRVDIELPAANTQPAPVLQARHAA
jgi:signal transduction histidine kinase